jgi:catalase
VHCKFIGYVETALPLMQKAGIADSLDEGVIKLRAAGDVAAFIKVLGKLRVWGREPSVKLN